MSGSTKGLRYPVAAPITREIGGQFIYGEGLALGKAVQVALNLNESNNSNLYGSDGIAESDNSFSGGSVTLNPTRLAYDARALLYGDVVRKAGVEGEPDAEELSSSAGASGGPVGFGFYGVVQRDGKTLYRAIWIHKTTFSPPSETFDTKGESTTWNTPSTAGTITAPEGGRWKTEITVRNEQNAIDWLNRHAHITPPIGVLEVLSDEGAQVGTTQVVVMPELRSGNQYRISTGAAQLPRYDALCGSGFQDWDGAAAISVRHGETLLVVECNSENRARSAGTAQAATLRAAALSVLTIPEGAEVVISQYGTGIHPGADGVYSLTAGQYTFAASKEGYIPQTDYFEVTPEEVEAGAKTLSITLAAV